MHTTLQFIRYCLITGVTITVLLISIVGFLLLGSLPHYDGEKASPGLSAPVSIERDSLGTVTWKQIAPWIDEATWQRFESTCLAVLSDGELGS